MSIFQIKNNEIPFVSVDYIIAHFFVFHNLHIKLVQWPIGGGRVLFLALKEMEDKMG